MSNNTDPELYYRETCTREYYVRATDSSAASSSKELVYNPNYTNNSSSQGSQSSQSSQDSTGSKQGWSGLPYQVTRRGTNDQGNHYCNRDYGPGTQPAFHYSNNDGSYYYQNPDGSKYYNDGQGFSKFDRAEKK